MRHLAAPGIALSLSVGLLLTGCAGSSASSETVDPTPAPTVTITVTPTPSIGEESTAVGSPSPILSQPDIYRGEWEVEDAVSRKMLDGSWHVGEGLDIEPWSLVSQYFENSGCQWRVFDSTGEVIEEVKATMPIGNALWVQDGDVLQSSECTVWTVYAYDGDEPDLDEIQDPLESLTSNERSALLLPGTYLVGESIQAGRYELLRRSDARGECSFAVSRKLPDGRFVEDIEFESTNAGARSVMNHDLFLKKGQIFRTDGCGAWQRVED